MEIKFGNDNLPIERIKNLLNQTYWAKGRSIESVKQSIDHSVCITAWDGGRLVGFMRIVTDYSTVFWLCDVVVDNDYRGRGVGKAMMDHLSIQPFYNPLKGILATNDAHGLYEQYGFYKEPLKMMMKDRQKNQ